MRTIGAAKFKAECLKIMDEVHTTGEPVVVTRRGKVLVRIVPERPAARKSIIGCMAGQGEIIGPIEGLFSTGIKWDAER